MRVGSIHTNYIASLSKNIREKFEVFKIVSDGISGFDKAHLLIYTLLLQIPRSLQEKIPKFYDLLNLIVKGSTVRRLGCLFIINTHDDIRHHTDSVFEREILDWFKVPECGVFMDVGANIGRYTITLAKKIGLGGRILAFEPCSSSYSTLLNSIHLNNLNNVTTLPLALWNKEGCHHIYTKTNAGSNSLIEDEDAIGKEQVKTMTLDRLLSMLYLARVDLIKIDVEGAEKEVLEGMKNTLLLFKPRLIIEVRDNNKSWVDNFLNHLGYSVQDKKSLNYLYECV